MKTPRFLYHAIHIDSKNAHPVDVKSACGGTLGTMSLISKDVNCPECKKLRRQRKTFEAI